MATYSESDLVARVRRRADMENSAFVTDAEIRDYLNVAIAELHDIVVQKYEDYYVKASSTMDLSSSTEVALPSDFYKALGVDLALNGNTYSLQNYVFGERNMYSNSPVLTNTGVTATRYHIQDSNINFVPSSATGTATLYYVRTATQFGGSVTSIASIIPGYDEYIVVGAAIPCLLKEESDVTLHMGHKEQLRRRIEEAAGKRNAGDSYAIYDVELGGVLDPRWLG